MKSCCAVLAKRAVLGETMALATLKHELLPLMFLVPIRLVNLVYPITMFFNNLK